MNQTKPIVYTVVYNHQRNGELRKNGTASVLIRAYLNGKNKYFNTGIYIEPRQWHSRNRSVIHHPNEYQLNQAVRDQITKIQRFEYEVRNREGFITLTRLADYENEKIDLSFTEFYEQQMEKQRSKLAPGSYEIELQTLKKLKAFRKEIHFSELTARLLGNFISSLHEQELAQNTVYKHYKTVRKYINLAVCYDYLSPDKNPCKKISVKQEATDRLYLTENELKAFEKFEIPKGKEHWRAVLDFFLFSCYTGLRFSDVAGITEDDMIESPEGIELFLRSQKTKKPYRQNLRKLFPIPGITWSRPEVIAQRRLEWIFPDEPVFVYTCRVAYAKQLKAIAKLLNVRERVKIEISTHTGRHTFGTVMAGKLDVHILKELMQHSNIRETMIYVHMNQAMVNKALDKVNW